MQIKYSLIFLQMMVTPFALTKNIIHVFGDSHASFCFSNQKILQEFERSSFRHTHENKTYEIPFIIHWLGPRTMHRIGRDGLSGFNIFHYGVTEEDIAVFIFGEIDVRVHIGKQKDHMKRDLDEVIKTLTSNYIHTIIDNKNLFNNVTFIIMSVMPPAPNHVSDSKEYPVYGDVQDRVLIAKKINTQLEALAFKNGFLFLDIYPLYADAQGILREELSDGGVHAAMNSNSLVKNALFKLTEEHAILMRHFNHAT